MRLRLVRVHGSYILGIGTLVILIFYLSSTVRDSRESVSTSEKLREEEYDSAESKSDFNAYIVSTGMTIWWRTRNWVKIFAIGIMWGLGST
jgi:hypothetical protein